MSKIVSFGDSFIFGWEMENNEAGKKTWPAIAAKKIDIDHVRCSLPGVGNDRISTQVYEYYSNRQNHADLAVINWTWSHRWDYYIYFGGWETWTTLGPNQKNPFTEGLSPKKLKEVGKTLKPMFEHKISDKKISHIKNTYNDFIIENQEYNKFRNLQTISSCNYFLEYHDIKSVQTFMDSELFDKEWHCPPSVNSLQNLVESKMNSFGGLNFLDWSRKNNFKVTEPGWHPLEDAHEAAAEYWLPTYKELLE